MKEVLKKQPKFILFTIILGFFSGFGQTYCISIFNGDLVKILGVNIEEIAKIYGLATLFASFFLPFIGKMLDRSTLKTFTLITTIFLSLSFLLFSNVMNIYLLFIAYFFIRLLGQSTIPLIGSTAISKSFGKYRGSVLSLKSIGKSLGEGLIPIFVIYLLSRFEFVVTTQIIGGISAIFLIPAALFLVNSFKMEPLYEENISTNEIRSTDSSFDIIKRDYRLYLLILANIALGFILTGVFFHNQFFIDYQSLSFTIWGGAFISYSLVQLASTFIFGYLVDQYGSHKLVVLKYFPLIIGFIVYQYYIHPVSIHIMFACFGLSVGISSATSGSLMAEIFGEKSLGRITGVFMMFVVLSTSVAPFIFSKILKIYGVSQTINFINIFLILSTLLLIMTLKLYRKK